MKNFYAEVSKTSVKLISREKETLLEELPIIQAGPEHRSFILSTWVRSYEPHVRKLIFGPTNLRIATEAYRSGESGVAERHWEKSHVVVSPDNQYAIHGWVCAKEGYLWHVYVPPALRRCGIGKGLVANSAGTTYDIWKPWPEQPSMHVCRYNPWLGC